MWYIPALFSESAGPCPSPGEDNYPEVRLLSLNTISRHWKHEFGCGMLMDWHVFPPLAGPQLGWLSPLPKEVPFHWAINTSPATGIKHQWSGGTCPLGKTPTYRAPRCPHGPVLARRTALPVLLYDVKVCQLCSPKTRLHLAHRSLGKLGLWRMCEAVPIQGSP